jgi:hypothetical protein
MNERETNQKVWTINDMCAFAESEAKRAVAEALAPREPSPELAEAERWLAGQCPAPFGRKSHASVIASELVRLSATVARLEAELAKAKGGA